MAFSLLIVVPTLNSFSLLPRLLASLQSQSWPYWQLLFVDGPSSSEHRDWLSHFCSSDSRCRWIKQKPEYTGIFGAMNQVFEEATSEDCILFLGSDDWLSGPNVLSHAIQHLCTLMSQDLLPDLLVCRGRYAVADTLAFSRSSVFQRASLLNTTTYRRALFFGSTPPHQATLFGPGARRFLPSFSPGFSLSADLDYFLKLSCYPNLLVSCLDLEFVYMSDSGTSAQNTLRRLREVCWAYFRTFSWCWLCPFIARYFVRLSSLLTRH